MLAALSYQTIDYQFSQKDNFGKDKDGGLAASFLSDYCKDYAIVCSNYCNLKIVEKIGKVGMLAVPSYQTIDYQFSQKLNWGKDKDGGVVGACWPPYLIKLLIVNSHKN